MRRRSRSSIRAAGAFVVAAALTLGATVSVAAVTETAVTSGALPAALSAEDQACLDCHGSEAAAAKQAKDGRKVGVVPAEAYARSLHADIGCSGCHANIALPAHPGNAAPARNANAEKRDMGQVCRGCHAKIAKAYDRSFHAQRRRAGKSGPGCSNCHAAHEITRAAVNDSTNQSCSPCHDDAADTHRAWLPNAARHLQTVACDACHSPQALAQVDLRLTAAPGVANPSSAGATFEQLAEQVDRNHDGLDASEFRTLLDALHRQGTPVTVSGRIEPRSRVQSHLLPEKERAVRDCFACHDRDASPYKRVTVSMLDVNGSPVYYDAQQEILTSAVTIETLKGFYVLGGTRMSQLDVLLALCLGAGVSVPALHCLARRLWGRSRKNQG